MVSILDLDDEWVTAWAVDSDPFLGTYWMAIGGLYTWGHQR